ncbi:MAG: 2-oxoacid:acceptor oxidoreductase family protein, partial [Desulfobacterales bacterium]|nr:2-oxoacid:acceptor oxidoreductase family protein [Desulfobacterales bacterium]
KILALLAAKTARVVAFDALALARQAGAVLSLNMVLLGALVQAAALPVTAEIVRETIATKTKAAFARINLTAFDLGVEAARTAS